MNKSEPLLTSTHNVISVSGGKDSTALLLLAIEREVENMTVVFADTGNEHPAVYEYLEYLEEHLGIEIFTAKADFSKEIEKKRRFVSEKWPENGVTDDVVRSALEALKPTGNPFLDLCIWKGRFPSSQARFCTEELKIFPMQEQVIWPILKDPAAKIESWQGIRWDESKARSTAVEREGIEPDAERVFAYRPLLSWSAADVFNFHRKHGVKWNPLYEQGMSRVGCMPCVNCRKDELKEIAARFPGVIERLRDWEAIVSSASKRGSSTFFITSSDPTAKDDQTINYKTHGIDRAVEWAMTDRGGRQYSLLASDSGGECSSSYGLCEATTR